MWIGNASARCAGRIILVAFCRLLIVGLEVSLADRDTLADKSTRVLVDNHWGDPLIPLKVVNPAESSLFLPFSRCRFFGRLRSAVDNFEVNSLWSMFTE